MVRTAGKGIACATVIPGWDDTKLVERVYDRRPTDRRDGSTYRALWEKAIAANVDWVLITSWNEWFENSIMEPTTEFGEEGN